VSCAGVITSTLLDVSSDARPSIKYLAVVSTTPTLCRLLRGDLENSLTPRRGVAVC